MDTLGWDYPAPNNDCTENDCTKHGPNGEDSSYDLWELNCCVVRDAYRRGNIVLWDRVLAHWDLVPTKQPPA